MRRPAFASPRRWRAGAVPLTGALLTLTACLSAQDVVTRKEDRLAAAGFIVRPANTSERKTMLASLPAHHFVQRVHGDVVNYVYADPLVCGCLYVGSQQAYNLYKQQMLQQRLADEQAMTADTYANSAWNWGAWGGFGYGFGPGRGW
jgi:hypothetical protein